MIQNFTCYEKYRNTEGDYYGIYLLKPYSVSKM